MQSKPLSVYISVIIVLVLGAESGFIANAHELTPSCTDVNLNNESNGGHRSVPGVGDRLLHLAQAGSRSSGPGSGARAGAGSNRTDRDEARRFYQEGNAHFEAQRYEDAVASYRKALELEPHFAPIYYNLGMSQMVLGDKQEAALNLERYLELRPKASNAEETRTLLKSLGPVEPARRRAWQLEADSRERKLGEKKAAIPTPKTAGPAVVTPGDRLSGAPPAPEPSKRTVAILPWRMVGSAGNYPQLLSGDLSKALKDSAVFDSLFSVYDSDFSLSGHLSKTEIDAATERIWPGTSQHSRSRQFNSNAACEIGKKLGAEAVLIGFWDVAERGNDIDSQDLQIHLIHVETGKVTTYSDRSNVSIFMGSFKPYLRDCVNRLMRQYGRNP